MDIKDLRFPDFLRYGLVGLNAILILFIFPLLIIEPSVFKSLNTSHIAGIGITGIVIGFLLDITKIYQGVHFNKIKGHFHKLVGKENDDIYHAHKHKFLDSFAEALGYKITTDTDNFDLTPKNGAIPSISRDKASYYFSLATYLSRTYGTYDLEARQSLWILCDHTKKITIFSVCIWLIVLASNHIMDGKILLTNLTFSNYFLLFLLFGAYVFIANRLSIVSAEEKAKAGLAYIQFAKYYRSLILNEGDEKQIRRPSMYMPTISAGGVVVRNKNGLKQIALVQRDDGKWVLPKGQYDYIEDADEKDTALREIEEELGIEKEYLTVIEYLGCHLYDEPAAKDVRKLAHMFLIEVSDEFTKPLVTDIDHSAAKWFDIEELTKFNELRYSYQEAFIAAAIKKLNVKT
jgi:8-oxo-dGTP pyrophosphatase MutT (NUDIX family)